MPEEQTHVSSGEGEPGTAAHVLRLAARQAGWNMPEFDRRLAQVQADAAAAAVAPWHAECDKVGVPYDPPGLVRHHRGNAEMASQMWQITRALVLRDRDVARTSVTALRAALEDLVGKTVDDAVSDPSRLASVMAALAVLEQTTPTQVSVDDVDTSAPSVPPEAVRAAGEVVDTWTKHRQDMVLSSADRDELVTWILTVILPLLDGSTR